MNYRGGDGRGNLLDAADVAGSHKIRSQALDVVRLALLQGLGHVGTEYVVRAGATAADVALRYLENFEAGVAQQLPWLVV